MSNKLAPRIAFKLYNLLWTCALPCLRLNHRLAEGYGQRRLNYPLQPADIWIQAASVGESYLALEIIQNLKLSRAVNILVTANTSQGIDILNRGRPQPPQGNAKIDVAVGYFPFDQPVLMHRAVAAIRPAAMVLLETEIWPGLLRALKQQDCRTIIINGRMTDRSLKRYLLWPSIWPLIRPDRVLAISPADADRFKQMFGPEGIDIMPNMKFDRVAASAAAVKGPNPLEEILPDTLSFAVMASVRRPEEPLVTKIIPEILRSRPDAVIGLFPRHLHRLPFWQATLDRLGIRWSLRSEARAPASPGMVIVWDTFGELEQAYRHCQAAFVGGSLAPLGGQNFLEALMSGIKPVIGPSWENFRWVGKEIIDIDLLRVAVNWRDVAALLIKDLEASPPRDEIIRRSLAYINERRGGTAQACRAIADLVADRE